MVFLVKQVSNLKMLWVASRQIEPGFSSDRFLGKDRLSDPRWICGITTMG